MWSRILTVLGLAKKPIGDICLNDSEFIRRNMIVAEEEHFYNRLEVELGYWSWLVHVLSSSKLNEKDYESLMIDVLKTRKVVQNSWNSITEMKIREFYSVIRKDGASYLFLVNQEAGIRKKWNLTNKGKE
jgi:hypothetical protein